VTLGKKAAHLHAIGMIHANYLCIWIWSSSSEYLKKIPLWPLFWGGAIYDPRNFICTNLNLLIPRFWIIQNISAFGPLVCKRNIFQIPNIAPILALSGPQKGPFPWFPYISLCKMKRPLVGPFLGGFYFYAQTLLIMSKGCCIWNSFSFGLLVHKKKSFKCISLYKPM